MPKQIAINSSSTGNYRTEVINNRPHLVTEMVSIEGDSVMNSLFYPMDSVESAYNQLDSLPAPAGHPTINGENVSAFHPMAVNAHGVGGFVRNPRMINGQVINELVFDIEVANKDERGKEIVERIENGQSIGVSTGLNALITKTNGKQGDRQYTGVVSNIEFDHVAVLLEETPAGENTFTINSDELIVCNVDETIEGESSNCKPAGNSILNHEVNDMDKEKLVLALIGNKRTRFTEADKDSLMSMSESVLVNAMAESVEVEPTVEQAQGVIEGAGMKIANAEYNADEFGQYQANKEAFNSFMATKADERKAKVEKIVANSKMTAEDVEKMSDEGIDNLVNSLSIPRQDYSAQGQGIHNHDRTGGSTIQLHEEA